MGLANKTQSVGKTSTKINFDLLPEAKPMVEEREVSLNTNNEDTEKMSLTTKIAIGSGIALVVFVGAYFLLKRKK